ncbi:MAG: hypothetical protein JSU70_23555 [Phycisphaerales bacterium]|nr:MAG: hypothetical protein JSU70_23555 [Phycisphaerales bacterium]
MLRTREKLSFGLVLPLAFTSTLALLELLSFVHVAISAAIAIDKLILFTIVLSPVAYVSGAAISLAGLIKSPRKATASVGLILNIVLLITLAYFGKSFLKEFYFTG